MTAEEVIKDIKKKSFSTVYLLYGEENYFIDAVLNALDQHVLTETEKAFNRTVLYGKEINGKQLLDSLRRYPMMASHQLVLLKQAQSFTDWNSLIPYFEKPNPLTIFAIAYEGKSPDKRKKWFKILKSKKEHIIIESKRIYENKIPAWVNNYLAKKGKTIDPKASRLLSIFVGSKLSNVVNELDKLLLGLGDEQHITLTHIEQNIGVSKKYNVFELLDALGQRDVAKVNYISLNLSEQFKTQPLIMLMPAIYSFFAKVYATRSISNRSDAELANILGIYSKYFVKDYRTAAKNYTDECLEKIFDILRHYDARLKGIDGSRQKDKALLEEMVQQIVFA